MKKTLSFLLVAMLLFVSIGLSASASEDWLTLRVEIFDRAIAGFNVEDNMQLKYIQEKFGDPNKIKVQFVPVSRWDEGEILTTQLGGGIAPDLCMTYNGELVNQYIDMGGLHQLDALLNEYAPNLKAFLGDELLGYGQKDTDGDGTKEQYIIPARRISVANVGNFIRGDWLAKLNLEKPTNVDEFIAYLYAAKEANLGGQQTIPFFFDLYEADPIFNAKRWIDTYVDFAQVTEEDWIAYNKNHEMLPGAREGLRVLNKLYHDGVLYENFAINDDNANDSNLVQGYFGFFSQQPDQPWRFDKNYQKEMEKNVEGAYWTTVNCFVNPSNGKALHDVYAPNGMNIFIPASVSEETAVAAVKLMDWMSIYENMFFLQNGMEGINYLSVNEDGIPVEVQGTDVVPDENKMHAGDVCFIANGLYYGSPEKNAAALSIPFAGYEDEVVASYADALTDPWTQVSFPITIQADNDYGAMVKSKQGEFLTAVVTCSPEEFDTVYDEFIQAIMETGAEEMIEEFRAAYLSGNYRGTYPGAE